MTMSVVPRPAPARHSASAAQLASLSIAAGRPNVSAAHVRTSTVRERDVHGEDSSSRALVDRGGNPDPHGGHAVVADGRDRLREAGQQGIGGLDGRRPALDADDRPVALDDADDDLRPADVDADRALRGHGRRR